MPTVNFLNNYGTLTYTINKSGVIGDNDEITLKLTFKPTKQKMYGYEVSIRNPLRPNSGVRVAEGAKSISKGSSGSVTITFKPGSKMNALYFSDRSAALVLDVAMALNSAMDEYESTDPFQTDVTVIKRIAPEIASHSFQETRLEDITGIVIRPAPYEALPLNIFGTFVQIASSPKLVANVILDPLDPALTAQHSLTLKQGENTLFSLAESVSGSSVKILTGSIAVAGQVDYEYIVTDSVGMSSSVSGSFNVLEYALPVINKAIPKRYAYEYDGSGNSVLVESEEGTIVKMEFSATMTTISGNGRSNTGTLTVVYGKTDDESDRTSVVVADDLTAAQIDTVITFDGVEFSDSQGYVFEVKWSDLFRSAKSTSNIHAAGADFEVTPDGVSVGMITGGTATDKRFEVAETHESFFYGGIAGVTNYHAAGVEELTGGKWIDNKPIYRQRFRYTIAKVDTTETAATIANFGDPVRIYGFFYRSTDGYHHQLNFYRSSDDYNYAYLTNAGLLRVRSSDKAVVTAFVEYTKSTD